MALMPKRVKHRKSQRGRIKGNATRGNRVVFGEYGLQTTQGGWISAQTIEAGDYPFHDDLAPDKVIAAFVALEDPYFILVCGQDQAAFAVAQNTDHAFA